MTKQERITAVYMHLVRGVQMQDLAVIYNVNIGRIPEAVNAVNNGLAGLGK